jgi:hypothetical protein
MSISEWYIFGWLKNILSDIGKKNSIRWESESRFMGKPIVAIAWGPSESLGEQMGHAKGIIAIGQIATGIISIGFISNGIISFGLVGIGIVSFTWFVGLGVVAFSGLAFGVVAFGGAAIGLIAFGGMAIGYVAIGGFSVGVYSVGGFAVGKYIISSAHIDPQAIEYFSQKVPWLLKSFGIGK